MSVQASYGKVTLAGAGPGDAELITVKLQQRLATADVIITDRLVNPEIIANYAKKNVEIITAGKQGFNDASYTQDEVTAFIIEQAKLGKQVLRLKGGDIAFFSNVLHELEALQHHQIPYEIIPGISAASGISAYTGMPLTARGFAQGVHFITFNPNSTYTEQEWKALAATDDTLVCYMASNSLAVLVKQLLSYGSPAHKPLALIEQGTTVYQQVHITTLEKFETDFTGIVFSSPSLIVIGSVVSLHEKFKWFAPLGTGSVFNELPHKKSLTK